ncbi:MAG: BtpA/SgcQ family protein, partial [Planctomycetota bacterium]
DVIGDVPLGINVLRNDGRAAIAIAAAVDARFVRINVLTGARVTDQGIIEGDAANVLRDRATLGATEVEVWADVDVKHSAPLARRPIDEEVADTLHRGGAAALIVSGGGTGLATDPEHLASVKRAAGSAPVLIGSGATAANVGEYRDHAAGFIVGTSLKPSPTATVDVARVRAVADVLLA